MTVSMNKLEVGQIVAYKPDGDSYRRHPSVQEGWGNDTTLAGFKAGVWGVPAIVLAVGRYVMVQHPCGKLPQLHDSAKRSVLIAYPYMERGTYGWDYDAQLETNGTKCGVERDTEWRMAVVGGGRLEDWDLWLTLRQALALASDEFAVKQEVFQKADSKLQLLLRQYENAIHKATIAHFEAIMAAALPEDAVGEYGTKVNISRDYNGVTIRIQPRLAAKLVSLPDTETWEANIADAQEARRVAQDALNCKLPSQR